MKNKFLFWATIRSGHNAIIEWVRRHYDHEIEVANVENERLSKIIIDHFSDRKKVIVIRDYLNTFASILKMYRNQPKSVKFNTFKVYEHQLDMYLDETEDFDFILYNQWVSSKKYRDTVRDMLCLPQKDINSLYVPSNGGGSSFDGMKYNGKADKMDVLNRYKDYIDRPCFENVLERTDLIKKSELIFGVYK